MSGLSTSLLVAIALVPALAAAVLWLQVLVACWPRALGHWARASARRSLKDAPPVQRPRLAVLVPAHNEAAGIANTLVSILAQLNPGDRLLVVADNCVDNTSQVSALAGAEVVERHDVQHRGKGYALDFGVRHLSADPPPILVMVDADCVAAPGALDALAASCAQFDRPAQALYLMQAPPGAKLSGRLAEFAWRVKNQVRPLGSWHLGGPCQLVGSGMAFPWRLISKAPLASGQLVEDMQLGIDLAMAGKPPLLVPQALVTSRFPDTPHSALAQRKRWEHGHLAMIGNTVPALIAAGILRADGLLLALALDILVPPLALLSLLTAALALLNLGAWLLFGAVAPLAISLLSLALIGSATVVAWLRFGAGTVSGSELLLAPIYAVRKLPIYLSFLVRRQTEWIRAKRDGE